MQIISLPAFTDNYIWCIRNNDYAIVVDPGDAKPVLNYLVQEKLKLLAILTTHKHADHCGGVLEIMQQYSVPVYGPLYDQIPQITEPLIDQQKVILDLMPLTLKVLDIPGHTREHIAYFNNEMLFCGDTLFSCGCGRIFEGTPSQLYQSLQYMAALPNTTKIYCGHEYTQKNIEFALQVEPHNLNLLEMKEKVVSLRAQGLPTLPSTILLEKAVNPFLRCDVPEVIQAAEQYAEQSLTHSVDVFRVLRSWKDVF